VYPLLSEDFNGIEINVRYTNLHNECSGSNGVGYSKERGLCDPFINLDISKDLKLVEIEKAICHEINHLYEIYERPKDRENEKKTIERLLAKDGNVDYDKLMELRQLPISNYLAYMLDIIYML